MSEQSEARERIRNEFGTLVAQKASEAFVLVHSMAAVRFGVEVAGPSALQGIATVLELDATAPRPWLEHISDETVRSSRRIAREMFNQIPNENAELMAATAFRRLAVEKTRDAFFVEAGGVLDELAKATGGPLGPLSESTTLRTLQPQLVDACWLNSTVRTAADARTVAVVADDPRVQVIDVPRRLFKEINATATLVGVPAFRTTHQVSGKAVNVAIIDSEVSRQHLAFGTRVIHKANFTREPWGNPDSHGTAVAGIVGAVSDTVSGMAPDVTIYNYKVLATVDALNADDFGGALAIQQALEDGAHVANCSWGAGPATNGTSREARACNTAWALGLILVKSAGNRGPRASTLTTPADAEGIIVVGATDRTGGTVPSYSSRGPTGHGVNRPHLVAPGGAPSDAITSCLVNGGFGFCGHGTSFAAPHVTGLIALLLNVNPEKTPDEIRQSLLGMCTPLTGFGQNDQGAGLLKL